MKRLNEIPSFLRKYSTDRNYFDEILPDFVKINKNDINLKLWQAFGELITNGRVGIVILDLMRNIILAHLQILK